MSESTVGIRAPSPRYYIGEWYGHDFATLPPETRSTWATAAPLDAPCPYKAGLPVMTNKKCSKEGGVCSLRLYAKDASGNITPQEKRDTVCPHRFLDGGKISAWVGEHILNDQSASVVPEVPFLNPTLRNSGAISTRAIGKIDHVLVSQKMEVSSGVRSRCKRAIFLVRTCNRMFPDMPNLVRDWFGRISCGGPIIGHPGQNG